MSTNLSVLFAAAATFCVGFVTGYIVDSRKVNDEATIASHWSRLEEYLQQVGEPATLEVIDNMMALDRDIDPLPSLAALASANEILHVDLVFPNVPASRHANTHWMTFVNEKEDILYVEGNPEYVDFKTSGVQPLHLNLWFRRSAVVHVQELIRQLESVLSTNSTRTGRIKGRTNQKGQDSLMKSGRGE
jgi:hypothetical protein